MRNVRPNFAYGVLIDQEKHPVKVHRAVGEAGFLYDPKWNGEVVCGRHWVGGQGSRSFIEVQLRLLQPGKVQLCKQCWAGIRVRRALRG